MSILRVLHANRLAVVLGSGLFCLFGFVAGCGEGGNAPATPKAETEVKTKQEDMAKARMQAFGKAGIGPSHGKVPTPKSAPSPTPKS